MPYYIKGINKDILKINTPIKKKKKKQCIISSFNTFEIKNNILKNNFIMDTPSKACHCMLKNI